MYLNSAKKIINKFALQLFYQNKQHLKSVFFNADQGEFNYLRYCQTVSDINRDINQSLLYILDMYDTNDPDIKCFYIYQIQQRQSCSLCYDKSHNKIFFFLCIVINRIDNSFVQYEEIIYVCRLAVLSTSLEEHRPEDWDIQNW